MDVLAHHAHNHAVIKEARTDVAATLNEADHNRVMGLAAEALRALGLAGPRQFGFVGLHGLSGAARRPHGAAWGNCVADAVHQEPSRLHGAIEGPLNLAG